MKNGVYAGVDEGGVGCHGGSTRLVEKIGCLRHGKPNKNV